MTTRMRLFAVIGLVAIVAVAISAVTLTSRLSSAEGDDDNDPPITGAALEEASAAALAHTGEGQVTETEVGDEDGFYEVEVTLEDGSQVDVHLDAEFNVISSEVDDDTEEDDDDDD